MFNEQASKTPDHPQLVRIHIDQRRLESPSPTTGEELYRLGNVKQGLKLYREVHGDREDPVVERDAKHLHLKEDEHFHSGEPTIITIIVDGVPHEWKKPVITYAEVVTLYDPTYPQHPEITYSVKYTRGPNHNPEGILVDGTSVRVKEGMVFHVKRTGQS